jgi:hypothetical protein
MSVGKPGVAIDLARHMQNRSKYFPAGSLRAFAGKEVAFSEDGTKIVGHADDLETLWRDLRAAGIDPETCVFSSVPAIDEESWL